MAFERREYQGAAPQTTLSAGLTNAAVSVPIVLGTGYPTGAVGKFWIVIDQGTSNEEKIFCSSRTGNTITAVGRGGVNGDGTAAIAHVAGATVNHCFTAYDADEFNNHIVTPARDDHTQYLTSTRHNAVVHAFGGVLGSPGAPAAVGTAAAIGGGPAPAHEDHVHIVGVGAINNLFQFAAGVIPAGALASDAVTTIKILDRNVATSKIALLGVTSAELAAAAVTAGKVATGGISAAGQFAAGVVDATALAANAVTGAKLDGATAVPHKALARLVPSAGTNSASTVFANYPPVGGGPLSLAFTKRQSGTRVFVTVQLVRYYCVTNQTRIDFRITDGTINTAVASSLLPLSTEGSLSVEVDLGVIAAGAYTWTLQAKVVSAAGAVQVDTDSTMVMIAEEVYG